jgi:DnaK suppressor protein
VSTAEHVTGALVPAGDDGVDLRAVSKELHEQRLFRIEQLAGLGDRATEASPGASEDGTPLGAVTRSLIAAARFALADIDAALERIEDGRFGRCDRCHAAIPPGVLRAVPTIRTCLLCQRGAVTHRGDPEADTAPGRRRRQGLTASQRPGRHDVATACRAHGRQG